MAFNPFANFRKYQKIWMASILLVTMITFVLCTGVGQGDLSDLLLKLFQRRGEPYATIKGSNLYAADFDNLKTRRTIASEFMRKAGEIVVAKLDDELQPDKIKKLDQKNPKDQAHILSLHQLRRTIDAHRRRPFYFDGSVKINDLLDFKLWLAEADRLGIELADDAVLQLTQFEMGGRELFTQEVYNIAFNNARFQHQRVNQNTLMEILRDEYRVRLAQRVLGYALPTRLALSPGQVWDFYKEKRVEYRISLLPMNAEDFVKDVGAPDDVQLQLFFDQHKSQQVDPTSDKIGFALPGRSRIAYISIDPNSDFYKKATKDALALQATPLLSPLLPLPPYASLSLLTASQARLMAADDVYRGIGARGRFEIGSWMQGDVDASVAAWLNQNDPAAIAGLIGAGTQFDNGWLTGVTAYRARLTHVTKANRPVFEAGVRDAIKERAQVFGRLVGLGLMHQGKALPDVMRNLEFKYDYLPLSVVQDDMLAVVGREQARRWAQNHMQLLKRKLDEVKVLTKNALERVLFEYGQGIGLEQVETKDFYHRFNVDQAKELEPLRKSFIAYLDRINQFEGRDVSTENRLKEADFWKLFFGEGGEAFAASGAKYQAKPWPPAVRVQTQLAQQLRLVPDPKALPDQQLQQVAALAGSVRANEPVVYQLFDSAERPFLFWRIADEAPLLPNKLDEVRAQVVEAWKLDKARDKLMERATKITEQLRKSAVPGLEMVNAMDALKKDYKLTGDIIPLSEVTPLVPVASGGQFPGMGGQRTYREFDLPPGLIKYPRKDMKDVILNLYDLKKPVETGYPPLDALNKRLYDEISREKNPQGKFIQVLTNQPRTNFYIAMVRDQPFTSHLDFNRAAVHSFDQDALFERAQHEAAKKLREDMVQEMRSRYEVKAPDEEVRKRFDSDAGA